MSHRIGERPWRSSGQPTRFITFCQVIEKQQLQIIFPHATIIPYQDFLHGQILFHLDNPGPDPVESKMISNPNPKNTKYPAGLDSKIRILYTTGRH